jgi:hypothetical protein
MVAIDTKIHLDFVVETTGHQRIDLEFRDYSTFTEKTPLK